MVQLFSNLVGDLLVHYDVLHSMTTIKKISSFYSMLIV